MTTRIAERLGANGGRPHFARQQPHLTETLAHPQLCDLDDRPRVAQHLDRQRSMLHHEHVPTVLPLSDDGLARAVAAQGGALHQDGTRIIG